MKYKYGDYPHEQFHDYKKRMHKLIHWLLIYAEEQKSILDNYFDKVQRKMDGLNSLLGYPTQIIEIMNLIESAKIEFHKPNYSHNTYRKIILDIHELIDKIPEE